MFYYDKYYFTFCCKYGSCFSEELLKFYITVATERNYLKSNDALVFGSLIQISSLAVVAESNRKISSQE